MLNSKITNALLVAILCTLSSFATILLTTSPLTQIGIRSIFPLIWSVIASVIYFFISGNLTSGIRALLIGLIVGLFCGVIGIWVTYFVTDEFLGIHDRKLVDQVALLPNYAISVSIMGIPLISSIIFFIVSRQKFKKIQGR